MTEYTSFATHNQNRAADALKRASMRGAGWIPHESAMLIIAEFAAELNTLASETAHAAAQIACGNNPLEPGLGETAYALYTDTVRAVCATVAGVEL